MQKCPRSLVCSYYRNYRFIAIEKYQLRSKLLVAWHIKRMPEGLFVDDGRVTAWVCHPHHAQLYFDRLKREGL